MIVVLGLPRFVVTEEGATIAAGRVVSIAVAAVEAGSGVEIAGRIGDDSAGDAVVIDLARRGIGHAALLRIGGLATPAVDADSGPPIIGADVELALRYLPGYRVIVAADELDATAVAAASDAASWAGASLVVVGESPGTASLPEAATILRPSEAEPDGAFASLVGRYAAALDQGIAPEQAFADLADVFKSERIG